MILKIVWNVERSIPEMPSPLLYQKRLFLSTNGGVVNCLDSKTGESVYRKRLGAGGQYSSSPIAADGRVYVCSNPGTVAVFDSSDDPQILASNELGERIYSTPALHENMIYVRTEEHLYAFGRKVN